MIKHPFKLLYEFMTNFPNKEDAILITREEMESFLKETHEELIKQNQELNKLCQKQHKQN